MRLQILVSTQWPQAASKLHEAFRIQVLEGGGFGGPFPLLSVVILENEMYMAQWCKEEMKVTHRVPSTGSVPGACQNRLYDPVPCSPYSQPG